MPELPEVEAVCYRLRHEVVGIKIVCARILRPSITQPQRASRVEKMAAGRVIDVVDRCGKNILVVLSGDIVLRIHLRMTGRLYVIPDSRFRPSTTRMYFELADGRALVFDDPRALGKVSVHRGREMCALLARIGPEPLDHDFTPASFIRSARLSRQPVKLYLMNQRRVAGMGNIYAAEALFQAGIHPARPIGSLSPQRLRRLHGAIVNVLQTAVDSAIAAYERPGGFAEGESYPVAVYGREGEPCPACGKAVQRIPQGGRSTYFCPRCQRM